MCDFTRTVGVHISNCISWPFTFLLHTLRGRLRLRLWVGASVGLTEAFDELPSTSVPASKLLAAGSVEPASKDGVTASGLSAGPSCLDCSPFKNSAAERVLGAVGELVAAHRRCVAADLLARFCPLHWRDFFLQEAQVLFFPEEVQARTKSIEVISSCNR